ncbi:hypothetical protein, variant [Sphaeroforma arctica JP610]|uniref:Holocytochrome c-type synthase n=1 Tax=Sphaeroforma arctica JP610 TaxID=667725 RepID=A0A0L0G6H6_9EUKA|nr:hypothetical protein, variant [Sphaeroforma arctica JP610]KNC83833.1 hypothetical protein, variant [Sphaeroforma arctica JP610]|eukprot:XP_014157735.1 hypothetical protein, variant [Sphaeroforma arctica JP610]
MYECEALSLEQPIQCVVTIATNARRCHHCNPSINPAQTYPYIVYRTESCPVDTTASGSTDAVCPVGAPEDTTLGCKSPDPNSEELDPTNNMYKPESMQSMHPKQTEKLETERVTSTIPRVDGHKWVYPSPQMFYNAMAKKGWDPKEQDMSTVVAIHNNVNEQTWHKVMMWESLHPPPRNGPPPPAPTLKSFEGKPTTLTPKARFNTWMGKQAPFDRHDWVIERGPADGPKVEVRYVIDFYAHDPGNGMPPTTLIDARPAIDSFGSLVDRFRMRALVLRRKWGFDSPNDSNSPGPVMNS